MKENDLMCVFSF